MDARSLWRMWWSGFFGLAGGVHLVRAVTGLPLAVGGTAIPLWVSWVVFPLAGLTSAWLIWRSGVLSGGGPREG